MSWFPSWLPSIPNLNLSIPTSIQGRFVSFFLKKFLGHFFKQGQLDTPQIDSQIGSGYVQINDLEFDPRTINSYLIGLPVVVEEGVVKAVTARIPWPNPLTSTIGFSLNGLHLKLRLKIPIQEDFVGREVDLEESVVSAAESFVQQELSDPEEAKVWESFHAAAVPVHRATSSQVPDDDHSVPGGLGASAFPVEGEHGDGDTEFDPAGVSMFATLFERLLARFRFDAKDIHITLVDPNNVTFKFTLSEIQYSTSEQPLDGTRRTLALHGVRLSTIGHIPPADSLAGSTSTTRPVPIRRDTANISDNMTPTASPTSSSSSMDEDAQFHMSQSLAGLPPRAPASVSNSMASSVYHSIISERPSLEQESQFPPTLDVQSGENERSPQEHILLSFGLVPIEIHLNTPSPHTSHEGQSAMKERYRLAISCGSLAVAIQPWQIACISQALENSGQQPPSKTPSKSQSSVGALGLDGEVQIKCLSVLLMGSQPLESTLGEKMEYYFEHPLSPPQLEIGYTRLFLDSISASGSFSESPISTLAVKDISAFHFTKPHKSGLKTDTPIAIPIVITDPHLPVQYDVDHTYPSRSDPFSTSIPQPSFPVMDWFDKKCLTFGAKLSQWRTRRHDRHTRMSSKGSNETKDDVPEAALCAHMGFESAKSSKKRNGGRSTLDVQVAPLHFFVDVQMVQEEGGLMKFATEVVLESQMRKLRAMPGVGVDYGYLSDEDEPSSADDDFYPPPLPQPPTTKSISSTNPPPETLSWSVDILTVRVSIRVPPPPGCTKRSGILVVDVHKISASSESPPLERQLRFAPTTTSAATAPSIRDSLHVSSDPPSAHEVLGRLQCGRIVIGVSSAVEEQLAAVLSIGPLQPSSDQDSSLSPQVTVSQREDNGGHLAVNVDVPSVYLSLSKGQLDSIQYWMDDLGQAMERMNGSSVARSSASSKDASLIGSRYFVKSRSGSAFNSRRVIEEGVKTSLSLTVTELYCRVHLPRSDTEAATVRSFDVAGADLSAVVKVHHGGKLEAIVNMMDVFIQDFGLSEKLRTFLSLTAARSLMAAPVPLVKLKFVSSTIPETTAKETRLSVSLNGFTFNFYPDLIWAQDLIRFSKSPPGTFEAVVPSERTVISLKISDGSVRLLAPSHRGSVVLAIGGVHFATDIVGSFPDASFRVDVSALSIMAIEDIGDERQSRRAGDSAKDALYWKSFGYATLADLSGLKLKYQENQSGSPQKQVIVEGATLKIHACADTFGVVGAFIGDLSSVFASSEPDPEEEMKRRQVKEPTVLSRAKDEGDILTGSIDESAFRKPPEIGPAPDMIYDDLPTNLDYLDESFGAAAGLRELTDDDFDEFDTQEIDARNVTISSSSTGIVSSVGGETIKLLDEEGINVVEDYYDTLPREVIQDRPDAVNETLRVRIHGCDVHMLLYDGYDWPRTRRTIEEQVIQMRKRLAKIKHLVANGQVQEPIEEEDTGALLFNSVYIGLPEGVDTAEPAALIAAIDEELRDDFETGTQSSWQSLKHPPSQPRQPSVRVHGKKLVRSKGPSIEFCLQGLNAEFNQYSGDNLLVSRTFVTVRDLEILDHIKTSTWKKFLTPLRSDSKGNVRETGANMVRIELHNVRPAPGHPSQEARLRAKILPIRLYVDQDAVDFLKNFFSFKDPDAAPAPSEPSGDGEAYIQMAEIFPIDLKLDYKPRRVDYRALKEGRTIELMNFFHFDGAEMTLRHITLTGITGWPKMFEMLNDLWTPDVKATQLVDVISGVAPIRSVVNVGSGVADLVLLPIAQYKKDGRVVRGVQKGATAFVKSTAIEAIKMGARLATGTQVILEQAEGLLGGEFDKVVTAETFNTFDDESEGSPKEELDPISKYSQQPADITEGVQTAYKSLRRNLGSAAQTILAVPMEVYERSGNEGPVRSVIRAVPIAVLKPMIGASEAVSKTLLGLHNTLDPNVRLENEAKYK